MKPNLVENQGFEPRIPEVEDLQSPEVANASHSPYKNTPSSQTSTFNSRTNLFDTDVFLYKSFVLLTALFATLNGIGGHTTVYVRSYSGLTFPPWLTISKTNDTILKYIGV